MLGFSINLSGMDVITNNLDKLKKGMEKLPARLADMVADDAKQTFKQRGSAEKKWPGSFQPSKELEEAVTKKSNLKIEVRKGSISVTPKKKIRMLNDEEFKNLTKRGETDRGNKRGGNSLSVTLPSGELGFTKLRSGPKVEVMGVSKKKITKVIEEHVAKVAKTFENNENKKV